MPWWEPDATAFARIISLLLVISAAPRTAARIGCQLRGRACIHPVTRLIYCSGRRLKYERYSCSLTEELRASQPRTQLDGGGVVPRARSCEASGLPERLDDVC